MPNMNKSQNRRIRLLILLGPLSHRADPIGVVIPITSPNQLFQNVDVLLWEVYYCLSEGRDDHSFFSNFYLVEFYYLKMSLQGLPILEGYTIG